MNLCTEIKSTMLGRFFAYICLFLSMLCMKCVSKKTGMFSLLLLSGLTAHEMIFRPIYTLENICNLYLFIGLCSGQHPETSSRVCDD